MAEIGIMIEGQEDLTWERFFRLAKAVEVLGFASLCLFIPHIFSDRIGIGLLTLATIVNRRN